MRNMDIGKQPHNITAGNSAANDLERTLMPTYGRLPITFARGEGCWLYDTEGNKYLDALSGIAVCGLGYGNEEIINALTTQAKQLIHASNLVTIQQQQQLAAQLVEISGLARCFFSNSGAEANETALKIARLYASQVRKISEPAIIVTEGAFHGRTLATLTASDNRLGQSGFEPLMPGFVRVPYNDVDALMRIAENNANVVAIMVEPVLGENGICLPDSDYIERLRDICDVNDWLLMLDEVQTGNARSGHYFAYQHSSILPDIVTTAKGLGNGMPIGVCIATEPLAMLLGRGKHGSTFGGNPLCCAVASKVVEIIQRDNLAVKAADKGRLLLDKLQQALQPHPAVKEVRGLGLLLGIELDLQQVNSEDCNALGQKALAQGVIIQIARQHIIRLLPPLIIEDIHIEQLVSVLTNLINGLELKK